jgi:CRISPR system Cascade subunit CasA
MGTHTEWIRPADITSDYTGNPVVRLDSNRADFNGALVQFLIALLQTCSAPSEEDDDLLNDEPWKTRFFSPPTPETLQTEFLTYEAAFNLDGEYPRFMQDRTVQGEGSASWDIFKLLIDGFGASHHFGKFDAIAGMGYRAIAVALISHQMNTTNSTAGSKNQHRSSLRNAGFLTTILRAASNDATLWQDIWLNILPKPVFENYSGNPDKHEIHHIFPWMGETRVSDGTGRDTFTDDEHPLTMYWAMPRRVHIPFEAAQDGICSVLPNGQEKILQTFDVKPDGFNYKLWKHPLTPIRYDENNVLTSFYKTDNAGVRYSDWLGIVQEVNVKKASIESAKVIRYFRTESGGGEKTGRSSIVPYVRIAAFGFTNDNAKILSYRYNEMPLYSIPDAIRTTTEITIEHYIEAANQAVYRLREACKGVVGIKIYKQKDGKWLWASPSQKSGKDSGVVDGAEATFWDSTETAFYDTLRSTIDALSENPDALSDAMKAIKQQWHTTLADAAMQIFRTLADAAPFEQADMRSVLRAELELSWFLRGTKKKNELKSLLQY